MWPREWQHQGDAGKPSRRKPGSRVTLRRGPPERLSSCEGSEIKVRLIQATVGWGLLQAALPFSLINTRFSISKIDSMASSSSKLPAPGSALPRPRFPGSCSVARPGAEAEPCHLPCFCLPSRSSPRVTQGPDPGRDAGRDTRSNSRLFFFFFQLRAQLAQESRRGDSPVVGCPFLSGVSPVRCPSGPTLGYLDPTAPTAGPRAGPSPHLPFLWVASRLSEPEAVVQVCGHK